MKTNVQLKNYAIALRKEGKSYNEILNDIPVAKSTLSNWLRDLPLSVEQSQKLEGRLKDRKERGRLKTGIALTARRLSRENMIYSDAKKEFNIYIKDPFFSAGILLYWAEGAKKNNYFAFINSDPTMASLMVKWLNQYFPEESKLLKYRLFIHFPYKNENCEAYWSQIFGVNASVFQKTIYKPTVHTVKKNPSYKGCVRLTITRINVLRKIMAWQKLLIQYYNDIVV